MVFSSILFLFLFLPITLLIYYATPKKYKNLVLLISSLFFYVWGEPVYIILLLFSTYISYLSGRYLLKNDHSYARRRYLVATFIILLVLLGFFKYIDFFISIINSIFYINIPLLELSLPIGISFYTFQMMSYSIDVYRKKIKPEGNYFRYLTYISMFPQLIAGPIVRYDEIKDELRNRIITFDQFTEGGLRFLRGLFKKVLLANSFGSLWMMISTSSDISMLSAWLGIIAFGLQIFFDFAGYSDMAIGIGKMLGFTFPENFNYPYIATSISDFFRRWHITLSGWFRDYVYIPLGGNRVGKIKLVRNLMIVWLLTGLWHGASMNFLLWGGYFGILLVIEKLVLGKKMDRWPNILRHIYTLFFVMISWVLFAITDMSSLKNYLSIMFNFSNFIDMDFLFYLKSYFLLLVIGILFSTPVFSNISKCIHVKWMYYVKVVCYLIGFILSIAYLVNDTYNPFLYFRF